MGCVIYYALTAGQHPFGGRLERDLNIQNGRYKLPELNKTSKFISLVNSTYYVLNRYAFTMNCIILEDRNMGQLYTISIVKISRFASQTLIPDRRTLCLHSRPSGKLSFDCQKIAKNWHFFKKKIAKNFYFFQKKYQWHFFWKKKKIFDNFFEKNVKFLAIFGQSIGNFPEGLVLTYIMGMPSI